MSPGTTECIDEKSRAQTAPDRKFMHAQKLTESGRAWRGYLELPLYDQVGLLACAKRTVGARFPSQRITLALQLLASMHQAATDFLVMHGYSRELVCQAVNIELGEALRGAKGGVRH